MTLSLPVEETHVSVSKSLEQFSYDFYGISLSFEQKTKPEFLRIGNSHVFCPYRWQLHDAEEEKKHFYNVQNCFR